MKGGNYMTTRKVKKLLRAYANDSMKALVDMELLKKLLAYQAQLKAQNCKKKG